MKYLIALLISFPILACEMSIPLSYAPTFLNPPVSGHYMKCEAKPDEQCLCIDGVEPWYSDLVDNEVLDYMAKAQEESCSDIADCDAKFAALVCSQGEKINNYDLLQVYCTYPVYKIEGKKFVENPTKKAAYLAAKAAEAQLQAAMAQARKAQACGKDTMAYLLVRNAQKQLSTAQVKQLVEAYATIKSLLESGSLTTAKEEISAAVADGVIVTEADKTALNAFIDECKP